MPFDYSRLRRLARGHGQPQHPDPTAHLQHSEMVW